MITGLVNTRRQALIQITIAGPTGQHRTLYAAIDTGFTGWLTLPINIIDELELNWNDEYTATLADGNKITFDTYHAHVTWDGHQRRIIVDSSEVVPLAGMALLEGHELNVEVRPRGRVTIRPLE